MMPKAARKPEEMIFLSPIEARRMEAAEEYGALSFAQARKAEDPTHRGSAGARGRY